MKYKLIGPFILLILLRISSFSNNNFQYGVNLTDASGNPLNLTTTFPAVQIKLYDQLNGGLAGFTETFLNVEVSRGSFHLKIGENGIDQNNSPNASLPPLAEQQIVPGASTFHYIEVIITPRPLTEPVVLSPRVKIPVVPVTADSNRLGGLTPFEWEQRILDAKNFYTDAKAIQAAKDDGDFLVKNLLLNLNSSNDNLSISVDDSVVTTKIFIQNGSSIKVFEVDSSGSIKAQTVILRGGLGLDGYLSRDVNNILWGMQNSTHVNLGEGSVTGDVSTTVSYAVVGGGFLNTAAGSHAVVAGGQNNSAMSMGSSVSGGGMNKASGNYSSVSGGKSNTAAGFYSSVSGGEENNAKSDYSVVAGGANNEAWEAAVVAGGKWNLASGDFSSVSGGYANTASGNYSIVAAGKSNMASSNYSVIVGGQTNRIDGAYGVMIGGLENSVLGDKSVIAGGTNGMAKSTGSAILGGLNNSAEAYASSVGGGMGNTASAIYSSVAGGKWNTASGDYSSISGGQNNWSEGLHGFVGGGKSNTARGQESFVGGGGYNLADKMASAVVAGSYNSAEGVASSVGGGWGNTASADYTSIGGGHWNTATNKWATVSGGYQNLAKGISSAIGGGRGNTAWSSGTIGGGVMNTAGGLLTVVSGGTNNWSTGSYTSIGGGMWNTATGDYTLISGGNKNYSSGTYSAVGGGRWNLSEGEYTAVAGGGWNKATGSYTSVGGGKWNTAEGTYNFIGSGLGNNTSGSYSSVSGGQWNTATGNHSAVVGGMNNSVTSDFANVGGGYRNTVMGMYSSVNGGQNNTATGEYSAVLGGVNNSAMSDYANIGGGYGNLVSGMYSSVNGGQNNTATGDNSTVLAGSNNQVSGNHSTVLGGKNLTISSNYSLGFNGSATPETISASSVVAFVGVSMGLGTVNPLADLHVNGTIMASQFSGNGSSITGLLGNNLADGSITASKIPQGELTGGLMSEQLILQGSLDISGKNSTDALQVRTHPSATVSFLVSSTGYVAVGTSTPLSQLTLKPASDGTSSAFVIADRDSDNTPVMIWQSGDEGFIGLRNNNTENVYLRANGDSYFRGGGLSIGTNSNSALLHLKADADGSGSGLILEDFNSGNITSRLYQEYGEGLLVLAQTGVTTSVLLRANGNSYFKDGSVSINTTTTQSLFTVKTNQDGLAGGLVVEDDLNSNISASLYQNSDAGNLELRSGNVTQVLMTANGKSYIRGGFFGVGTQDPQAELEVTQTGLSDANILVRAAGSQDAVLSLSSTVTSIIDFANQGSIRFDHSGTQTDEKIVFTVGNGTTPLELNGDGTVDLNGDLVVTGKLGTGTLVLGSGYSASSAPSNGAIIEGSVGIGQTNPHVNTKLAVAGGVSVGTYSNLSAPANSLIVSGKIGVGTDTPSQALEVNEAQPVLLIKATAGDASLEVDASDQSQDSIISFNAGTVQRGMIAYDHNNVTPDNEMLKLNLGGTDKFYFKGDGNFGIGQSSPTNLIHISSASAGTAATVYVDAGTDAALTLDANAVSNFSYLNFSQNGTRRGYISYDHDAIGTQQNLLLNINDTTPLIANGNNQIVIGGTVAHSSQASLEVSGGVVIGANAAAGTDTPPLNGLLVEGVIAAGGLSIDSLASSTFTLNASSATDLSELNFGFGGNEKGRIRYVHNLAPAAEAMQMMVGGAAVMYVTGTSRVGVLEANPTNTLDVEGTLAIGAGYTGTFSAPSNGAIIEGGVGIGESTPHLNTKLAVGGGISIGSYSQTSAPMNGLIVSGNVGVGTTTPLNLVSIAGSVGVGDFATQVVGSSNSLAIQNRLGVGELNPDAAIEVSSMTTAEIHLDGGSDATVNLDANLDTNFSNLNFSLAGIKRGQISYDHHPDAESEQMVFYTAESTTPLILSGNEKVIVGGAVGHSANAALEVSGGVIIGSTYTNAEPELTNGLLLEGRLSVGTFDIQTGIQVAINGAIAAGSYAATTAPTDGLIISGPSAFGTDNPNGTSHQLTISNGSLCVQDENICNANPGSEGTVFSSTTVMTGVDYAEYFPAEEILSTGQLVGLNLRSGKTRAYKPGDIFLGIISTQPGVIGGGTRDKATNNLVGLMGQLPFARNETIVTNGKVYTPDDKLIGLLLSTGDVYINGFSGDMSTEFTKHIKELEENYQLLLNKLDAQNLQLMEIKKQLNYIMLRNTN